MEQKAGMKCTILATACSLLVLVLALVTPGVCRGAEPKEIVVGSPVSRTGPGAPFGVFTEWAFKTVAEDVNKNGGIYMSKYKKKLPVKLVLYDDESVPEKATQAVQRLILKDKVHALFSTGNPMLVIPCGMLAERERMPMSAAACPVQAFLGAKPSKGWTWVWDIFFDELDMAKQEFLAMNTVQSNKKIALFTDNTPDGSVERNLWNKNALEMGYKVVMDGNFPVGTSDFGDMIRRAKEGEADIVLSSTLPPDGITLRKQMRTLGYKPKAAFFEKAGDPFAWWLANGEAAQGTMTTVCWHPSLPYPGAKELKERFDKDRPNDYSSLLAMWYISSRVMLDAIERAGSLDPKAINEAMAKTDKTFEGGPIKYNKDRVSALPTFVAQWQNGELAIVYPPKLATGKLIYPLP